MKEEKEMKVKDLVNEARKELENEKKEVVKKRFKEKNN